MPLDLLIKEIEKTGIRCSRDEPMRNHTSFRIGGPAALMVFPQSANELKIACSLAAGAGERLLVIGNGTNLLVADGPLSRIVVKTHGGLSRVERLSETELYAESGALLSNIAGTAMKMGLAGMEFAHGIPGTLGGAVTMNAGAYGGEMKDIVQITDYLNGQLENRALTGGEHDFSYRRSAFSETDDIILGSVIKLTTGDPAEIKSRMGELSEKRRNSQPLDLPSGGSTFKRPREGYAAALIEQAGLKGYRISGAMVSEKHAGFVVNAGGASFNDVLCVMEHVSTEVLRQFGIELEPEVKIIAG